MVEKFSNLQINSKNILGWIELTRDINFNIDSKEYKDISRFILSNRRNKVKEAMWLLGKEN